MALGAKRLVLGQPSCWLAPTEVGAFVTETGGHLGPVTFDRRGLKIQPLSVAPWAKEEFDPPLPRSSKFCAGDFFCLPFGGNAIQIHGEQHPVHGEMANARWQFESLDRPGMDTSQRDKKYKQSTSFCNRSGLSGAGASAKL